MIWYGTTLIATLEKINRTLQKQTKAQFFESASVCYLVYIPNTNYFLAFFVSKT